MEFRNDYPAFNGNLSIEETPEDKLSLTWENGVFRANAHIDLNTYQTRVTYFDDRENMQKEFLV